MNYNYTGSVTLSPGRNVFNIDYESLPDPWMTKLELKVYRYDWQSGEETVLATWILEDQGGQKQFEIMLN